MFFKKIIKDLNPNNKMIEDIENYIATIDDENTLFLIHFDSLKLLQALNDGFNVGLEETLQSNYEIVEKLKATKYKSSEENTREKIDREEKSLKFLKDLKSMRDSFRTKYFLTTRNNLPDWRIVNGKIQSLPDHVLIRMLPLFVEISEKKLNKIHENKLKNLYEKILRKTGNNVSKESVVTEYINEEFPKGLKFIDINEEVKSVFCVIILT